MTVYGLILFAHSLLRWLVLGLALIVCVRSLVAWWRNGAWQTADERFHTALLRVVDIQFLLGLLLYVFLSPLPRTFWMNLGDAMKEPVLRFYGLEHVLAMVVGIAVLHIGRTRSMAAATGALRHRRVWISTLAALVIIMMMIPWPDAPYGRPLFRGL